MLRQLGQFISSANSDVGWIKFQYIGHDWVSDVKTRFYSRVSPRLSGLWWRFSRGIHEWSLPRVL